MRCTKVSCSLFWIYTQCKTWSKSNNFVKQGSLMSENKLSVSFPRVAWISPHLINSGERSNVTGSIPDQYLIQHWFIIKSIIFSNRLTFSGTAEIDTLDVKQEMKTKHFLKQTFTYSILHTYPAHLSRFSLCSHVFWTYNLFSWVPVSPYHFEFFIVFLIIGSVFIFVRCSLFAR